MMMKPVSAVDNSNYHLLGNQLKGESHSSRMARVHAMQRGQGEPTLQPMGSFNGSLSAAWASPLLLAGAVGLAIGAYNSRPDGQPRSKKQGKKGATQAALAGAGVAIVMHGGYKGLDWSVLSDSWAAPEFLGVVGISALAAAMMHGVGRWTTLA
jgi:hypothetical protein